MPSQNRPSINVVQKGINPNNNLGYSKIPS
jgi:hypothetical protein